MALTDEQKRRNVERATAWNKAHPKRRAEITKAWEQRNPDSARERSTRWRKANPEKVRATVAAYQAANPEKVREWQRKASAKRRKEQPEIVLARIKAWKLRRRAGELAQKWDYWGGLCWMCGHSATEWDHVKPLTKGGSFLLANLRPACKSCNCRKSNKWPWPTRRKR